MAKLPPLASRGLYLDSLRSLGDKYYDAPAQLIDLPIPFNVHIEYLDAAVVRHPTRESLYYALGLFLIGGEENVQRASHLLRRVIDVQEKSDPEHPLYGLWHYFAEESVLAWPLPDTNWAAFNGLTLILIWHVAVDQLSSDLKRDLREAIRRAAICLRRKDTDPHYTNIALKSIFVAAAAAELLEDPALAEYAAEKMQRISTAFAQADSFAEYNSPTYAAVSLTSLGAIQTYVRDVKIREQALVIQHSFWRHIGRHFHVATGELAGPHSRAYHLTIRESPGKIGPMIERATHGLVKYEKTDDLHDAFGSVFTCVLDFDLPEETQKMFLRRDRTEEVREVARRFPEGGATETATYLSPLFSIGTVNFQDGWEQRHNLIAYWPHASKVDWLLHHYSHDGRPCSGGYFTAAQKEGCLLVGNFLSDFADEHPCFQTEGVTAAFMGPVLEMGYSSPCRVEKEKGGPGSDESMTLGEGETAFIQLTGVWIACQLLWHRSGLFSGPGRLRQGASSLRIEFPHYEGEARDIRWTDFSRAQTAYGLVLEPAGEDWAGWKTKWRREAARITEPPDEVRVEWAGLQIAFPNRIRSQGDVRAFYRSGAPWDSLAPRRLLRAR